MKDREVRKVAEEKIVIVESPITTLEKSIANNEWFKGIVLSATYFEHFGLMRLKERFKGKIDENKLEHLQLGSIIILLYGSGLIDTNTYSKMMKIKKKRNDLVHTRWTHELDLDPKDAEKLIRMAIECLKALVPPEEPPPD